jgi:hypothetical protein
LWGRGIRDTSLRFVPLFSFGAIFLIARRLLASVVHRAGCALKDGWRTKEN